MSEGAMNEGFSPQRHRSLLKQRRESVVEETEVRAKNQDWLYRDSGIENMDVSFKCVLPEGEQSLRGYLRRILEHGKKGGAVGIEFGGPGKQLFLTVGKDLFKKTAGVSLLKSDKIGMEDLLMHDDWNHEVIIGDILDPHTYDKVHKWLQGDKVDVIFERLLGGFKVNPEETYLVAKTFDRWYGMLAEEGVMFVQVPWWAHDAVEKWASQIQGQYGGTRREGTKPVLEVQYSYNDDEFRRKHFASTTGRESVLRLRKLKGAPQKLPMLAQ